MPFQRVISVTTGASVPLVPPDAPDLVYTSATLFGEGGSIRVRTDGQPAASGEGNGSWIGFAATRYTLNGAKEVMPCQVIGDAGTVNLTVTLYP